MKLTLLLVYWASYKIFIRNKSLNSELYLLYFILSMYIEQKIRKIPNFLSTIQLSTIAVYIKEIIMNNIQYYQKMSTEKHKIR